MTAATLGTTAPLVHQRVLRLSKVSRFSWFSVAAIVVSLMALMPLGFVAWVAYQAGWATVQTLVFRPRVGELLVNTGLLVLITVPLCTVLALALAWLTARSDLPGARTWAWLSSATRRCGC